MAARPQTESAKNAQPGAILLVVHEFTARSGDELSLAKGDRIELIERDDDFGDGWYLGRHLPNGSTGLFPEVYTTCAPKGIAAATQRRPVSQYPPSAPSAAAAKNSQSSSPALLPQSSLLPPGSFPNPVATPPATEPPGSVRSATGSQISRRPVAHDMMTAASSVYNSNYNSTYNSSHNSAYTSSRASPILKPSTSSATTTASVQQPSNSSANNTAVTETLTVIDEHMADMKKPGPDRSPRQRRFTTESVSEYSFPNNSESRLSYIPGSDTEDEEATSGRLTHKDVKTWSPAKVARFLESVGVERKHCKVFEEQEFSGEVILGMDQSSIFLKELDLGPVGPRLRIWQKIRHLQDAVSPPRPSQTRKISETNRHHDRRSSNGSLPQRHSVIGSYAGDRDSQTQTQLNRGDGSSAAGGMQLGPRPSAASVRSLGHSRRQSSIDQTINGGTGSGTSTPQMGTPSIVSGGGHGKHSSLDRNWSMISPTQSPPQQNQARLDPNLDQRRPTSSHMHSLTPDRAQFDAKRSSQLSLNTGGATSAADLDRGYMSSSEVDNTKQKQRLLRKRAGTEHNRVSSYETTGSKRISFFRRASRTSSPARSPQNDQDSFRAISAPLGPDGSPLVTNLEDTSPKEPRHSRQPLSASSDKPSSSSKGGRAVSDAITGKEKALHTMAVENLSPTDGTAPQSPTSSGDAASQSLESEDTANKGKYSTPLGTSSGSSAKAKDKKLTSAYVRGLEKKSPQEQMIGADYCGWMKKKSSHLMKNWKPRLFILRGRRLSYYYSENDTEEKGLIDISGHRVLPANDEMLTGIHATLTKATSTPATPNPNSQFSTPHIPSATSPTTLNADGSLTSPTSTLHSTTTNGSSIPNTPITPLTPGSNKHGFIFKLVPPRVGLSKAVNFTKPAVHYFAVPSLQEGRLWMAALVKATIDRDESAEVVTTYQQKTISLEKARARKERPPALMDEDGEKALVENDELTPGAESPTVAGSVADDDGTAPLSASNLDRVDEAAEREKAAEEADAEEKQTTLSGGTGGEGAAAGAASDGTGPRTRATTTTTAVQDDSASRATTTTAKENEPPSTSLSGASPSSAPSAQITEVTNLESQGIVGRNSTLASTIASGLGASPSGSEASPQPAQHPASVRTSRMGVSVGSWRMSRRQGSGSNAATTGAATSAGSEAPAADGLGIRGLDDGKEKESSPTTSPRDSTSATATTAASSVEPEKETKRENSARKKFSPSPVIEQLKGAATGKLW